MKVLSMKQKYVNVMDVDMPQCPECGGHPVRIWMQSRGWNGAGKKKTPKMQCYLHCACGECTTDWHPSVEEARLAYLRKNWAIPYSKRPKL